MGVVSGVTGGGWIPPIQVILFSISPGRTCICIFLSMTILSLPPSPFSVCLSVRLFLSVCMSLFQSLPLSPPSLISPSLHVPYSYTYFYPKQTNVHTHARTRIHTHTHIHTLTPTHTPHTLSGIYEYLYGTPTLIQMRRHNYVFRGVRGMRIIIRQCNIQFNGFKCSYVKARSASWPGNLFVSLSFPFFTFLSKNTHYLTMYEWTFTPIAACYSRRCCCNLAEDFEY